MQYRARGVARRPAPASCAGAPCSPGASSAARAAGFAPRGRVELKAAIDACVNREIPRSNHQSTSGKGSPVKLIFLDVDGVLNSHQSR